MIHAYDKTYLSKAQSNLGSMFDFAVYDLKERLSGFYRKFLLSEYWAGWALAYFQWQTNLTFKKIDTLIPIEEIFGMYSPYHEMDISHFCEKMAELYNSRKQSTNLKLQRQTAGFSQKELSEISGVPLRTIQQYEQGQKNINSAKAETVLRFAKALECSAEDLMEIN